MEKFLLSSADGLHCRSCTEMRAGSGQPGTRSSLQPFSVTPVRAPDFEVLMNHALLKLSSFLNMLLGLVTQNTSVTAVIKALFQCTKIFDSSYNVSF